MHITLEDAMQLEALACGDAQRPIRVTSGKFVLCQVLFSSQHAARNTRAYHKLVGLIHAGFARVAEVAVFLLVNAMKLDELHLRFGKARIILSQFLGYLPPQIVALALDMLNFASLAWTQIDQ